MKRKERAREWSEEFGSTSTLAVVGAYALNELIPGEFFENVREGLRMGRHTGKTIYDVVSGGPKGMKSAKNLQEALEIVANAGKANEEAGKVLEEYVADRKSFVGELVGAYKENENVFRVAQRVETQMSGTLKGFFEVGNSLKPEIMRKVDEAIIRVYGMDPIEAVEKSERLREFYKDARKFYDAREKDEHSVSEFCDFLNNTRDESVARNKVYNELFPEVVARVREGYETEDQIFSTGERNIFGFRSDVSKEELKGLGKEIDTFERNVDKSYESVRGEVPIEPYKEANWIDYSVNPLVLGIVGALAVKGASKLLPGVVERPIRYVTAVPNRVYDIGKLGVKSGRGLFIKAIEKLKNSRKLENME